MLQRLGAGSPAPTQEGRRGLSHQPSPSDRAMGCWQHLIWCPEDRQAPHRGFCSRSPFCCPVAVCRWAQCPGCASAPWLVSPGAVREGDTRSWCEQQEESAAHRRGWCRGWVCSVLCSLSVCSCCRASYLAGPAGMRSRWCFLVPLQLWWSQSRAVRTWKTQQLSSAGRNSS